MFPSEKLRRLAANAREDFPKAVLVPAYFDNERQRAFHEKSKTTVLIALYSSGVSFSALGLPHGIVFTDESSPYDEAITRVQVSEQTGLMEPGSVNEVIAHMYHGTFDESQFAAYLPKSSGQEQ